MKKSYKDYEIISLGGSDIARLTLTSPEGADILKFGMDSSYNAYLVPIETEIPDYYKKVFSCTDWLKIFDDTRLTFRLDAKRINIYRSGEHGCIIAYDKEG